MLLKSSCEEEFMIYIQHIRELGIYKKTHMFNFIAVFIIMQKLIDFFSAQLGILLPCMRIAASMDFTWLDLPPISHKAISLVSSM